MLEVGERRGRDRSLVEMPVTVTPVVFDGRHVEPLEDEMLALTSSISSRGIGFTHDEPLDAGHAIVTFDLMGGDPVSLLLEVRWSNLDDTHSYMSGGRFLGVTETPVL